MATPTSRFQRYLSGSQREEARRLLGRPFLEATMAASAMIAQADGTVSFSESHRLDQILMNLEELKVFDVHEAVDLFKDYVDAIVESPEAGRETVFAAIARIKDDEKAAALLVRICLSISFADGEFHPAERDRVEEICGLLGLAAKDFGI